ncbi:MAG: methylmalonyl-CoA epimerase, partial [Opitutales bacterium]|nr:methylmalonyl-CoA epimerase [Opitutales bacterium]
MLKQIDHLGIAVNKIEDVLPYYEKILGLKCEGVEEVPSQKVRTAFFTMGGVHLELLEPTSPDSPIAKYLEKNPRGGIHHVAFFTDDLPSELKRVEEAGAILIDKAPRPGAHHKEIAFLHPKSTAGILT